jgi:hypothetical protein
METQPPNGKHDVVTHRILVCGLAGCVVISTIASAILPIYGVEVPHAMSALSYTALGALAGMLSSIMKGGNST